MNPRRGPPLVEMAALRYLLESKRELSVFQKKRSTT